jgi:hypothetical protein
MFVLSGCVNGTKTLTLYDVEKSFNSVGTKYTEQTPPFDSKLYNKVAPKAILKMDYGFSDGLLKLYIYPSADEMKKGLREFQDEQSKDLTYGLKESTFQAKNVLFISKGLVETDLHAIDKLK